MYIMVKQLSNANPIIKRQNVKVTKLYENAVAMPAAHPIKFDPIKAGTRPKRSAIQPKRSPPTMAPQKNIDWAMVGNAAFSQTHSS